MTNLSWKKITDFEVFNIIFSNMTFKYHRKQNLSLTFFLHSCIGKMDSSTNCIWFGKLILGKTFKLSVWFTSKKPPKRFYFPSLAFGFPINIFRTHLWHKMRCREGAAGVVCDFSYNPFYISRGLINKNLQWRWS